MARRVATGDPADPWVWKTGGYPDEAQAQIVLGRMGQDGWAVASTGADQHGELSYVIFWRLDR
jgi:hypothetical protein